MKYAPKIFVYCLVSGLTWLITSSLIAQQKGGRPQPAQRPAVARGELVPREAASEIKNPAAPSPTDVNVPGLIAKAHLTTSDITVDQGVATVRATAWVFDKRPGASYIWRFRVMDHQEKPLAGRVYFDQVFEVGIDGKQQVDFQDTIDVPPGAKRIELVLYEKSEKADFSFLDDEAQARAHLACNCVKLLTP